MANYSATSTPPSLRDRLQALKWQIYSLQGTVIVIRNFLYLVS